MIHNIEYYLIITTTSRAVFNRSRSQSDLNSKINQDVNPRPQRADNLNKNTEETPAATRKDAMLG